MAQNPGYHLRLLFLFFLNYEIKNYERIVKNLIINEVNIFTTIYVSRLQEKKHTRWLLLSTQKYK